MKFHPSEPQPVSFAQANHVFVAPKGMEDSCGDLPAYRSMGDAKSPPTITACWQFPTRENRLKFLKTGQIWATIVGLVQPPYALSVNSPFQVEDPNGNYSGVEAPPRLVILESPYKGRWWWQRLANRRYARACMRDSLLRGEAPLASHLLYTQPGVLRDHVMQERTRGIAAGLAWGIIAEATVVYVDRGISPGMDLGMEKAKAEGRPIERRTLNKAE